MTSTNVARGKSDERPILQVGAYDAEATCAAMILRCLGRFVTVEELAPDLTYSRNQTDFDTVIECLATHNVEAEHFEVRSLVDFADTGPTLLAHDGRMLVALRVEGSTLIVNDPQEGRRDLSAEELLSQPGLRAVSFERGSGFVRQSRPTIWALVKPYLPKMAIGKLVGLTLAVQVVLLAVASLLGRVVDAALEPDPSDELTLLGIVIAVGAVTQFALRIARAFMLENVRYELELKLADSFVSGLQAEGVGLMRRGTIGDYTERLQSLGTFQRVISVTLVSLFADGLIGMVFLVALIVVSPPLVFMSLALAVVAGSVAFVIATKQIGVIEQAAVQHGRATSSFMELVSSADSATIMGLGKKMRVRWFGETRDAAESDRRVNRLGAIGDATGQTVDTVTQLVLLLGIWLILKPSPGEVGQWLSFVTLAAVAVSQLIGVGSVLGQLGSIRPLLWRVRGSLEALDPVVEDPDRHEIPAGETLVSLVARDVSVTADGGRTHLFDAAEFLCGRGEVVGIFGPSGCGKSTLLLGLASLHGISGGDVSYHYTSPSGVHSYQPGRLTNRIGFVPQTAVIHNMALADYVRAGRDHLSETDLRNACALAGLEGCEFGVDDILRLQLGELGSHVSGGQRQRIAIARALAAGPDLLFLDEATNTIGEEQERAMVDRLRHQGVSIVLVSHRTATLNLCDRLYKAGSEWLVESSAPTSSALSDEPVPAPV